ncbi:HEAT repeat domain-containing protein [Microcoleus vaginatus]|uniref:HEAT repeat domain-containing protein n=1 Tax=Microcoleus vaginatus TaxID=119532 RepID=UPI0019A4C9AD|nr:HEAT repeat domain-containing protein [Microcoleus sp. FACHB-45]
MSKHLEQPHPELFEKAIELSWLNRVGVDAENPLKFVYAFYHPTFQEYFAACEIEDWHFFLNHVSQNPQQGIYRIFERQWKEVMLLWMGRKDVDREEKEAFIKALVEFDDGCNYFYGFRAYFLAGVLIDEFKDCALADAIVAQIVQWGFGYFNLEKQERCGFLAPIEEGAKAILPESDRKRVIVALTELSGTSEHEDIRWEAVVNLGKIDEGNPDAFAALTELIRTSEDEDIRWEAVVILGKIGQGNPDAIATLTELIGTSKDEEIRWTAADSLGKIDEGNPDAIAALTELIRTSDNEEIRWGAVESLREIDEGNPNAIVALTELIRTSEDEDTRCTAVVILGEIGKLNPNAIAALTELIRTSEDEYIRLEAVDSLGKIGKVNPNAIVALTELIRTSEDEEIRCRAAKRLGEIEEGNPDSIVAFTELLPTSGDENIRYQAENRLGKIDTNRLGKIDEGNPYPIADLTQFILTGEDKSRQETAAFFLTIKTETQQMTGVVTALKNCLSDKTYENDFDRFNNSYKVIWHCAQNLPYPTFYHAWHHPPTTPHSEVPDLQTFPQDIAREINNQAELSNQIQLLCIDCKNFINPDNPAAKIYTEMLKQGCPKSEDGTPKTMADLQTYWDLLLMDSDKSFILVFYNSRGEEATGFSETFVNDLSKFDGNIAIVSENNADSLAAFSPNQSDLIGAIVRWICQVVWES